MIFFVFKIFDEGCTFICDPTGKLTDPAGEVPASLCQRLNGIKVLVILAATNLIVIINLTNLQLI